MSDFEVKVFEDGNHSLVEAKSGGLNEVATSSDGSSPATSI